MTAPPPAAVAEAFAASAVCPNTADQIRCCTHWTQEGLRLLEPLTIRVGRERWRTATAALAPAWSVADQARVLGLGVAMYQYIAAPLAALPGPEAAITAGALTQLTVALYDHLLDEGLLDQPLDVALFRRALWDGHVAAPPEAHPAAELVLAYTALWAESVKLLGRRDATEGLLTLAAHMAVTEAAVSGGSAAVEDPSERSRLPFQAVGAIARLATQARVSGPAIAWHDPWCAQLGNSLGMLDDIVDLDDDLAVGRVNAAARTSVPASEVVAAIEAVHHEWVARTVGPTDDDLALVLGVVARSWLAVALDELPTTTASGRRSDEGNLQ